jgi:glycosyltransferase involved in cell wall biosynthesis
VNKKVIAVIPAFNEAETINIIVKRTIPYVDAIIVVDDGSRDETSTLAKAAGAVVITHRVNQGVGRTISDGLTRALEDNADIIVTLDADGQHKPRYIPNLVAPIKTNQFDLVIGSRFLNHSNIGTTSPLKYAGNLLFSWLLRRLLRLKLTDFQSGFRALGREAAIHISLRHRRTYTHEMIVEARKAGLRMTEVPMTVEERRHGNSKVVSSIIRYVLAQSYIIVSTLLRKK